MKTQEAFSAHEMSEPIQGYRVVDPQETSPTFWSRSIIGCGFLIWGILFAATEPAIQVMQQG